ncbi:hypothetical protein KAR91_60630, partial [Candidatus Pacearchaeota archaeon]|nr:hypothetical protein [Candidatus Pacearchaeota archaeon]
MSFTVSKDFISVEMEYVPLDVNYMVVINSDEERAFFNEKKIKIKKVKAFFARPRWSTFNTFMKDVVSEDEKTGEAVMDNITFRQNKFRTLLEGISEIVKKDDGTVEEVPYDLDYTFFDDCMTDFAIGLVNRFDEKLEEERVAVLKKVGILDEKGNPVELVPEKEEKEEEKKEEPKKEKVEKK